MSELLEGAYVQAWVWVPAEDLEIIGLTVPQGHSINADECGPYCREAGRHVADIMDDEAVRNRAREIYHDEGCVEIDDAAIVSRATDTLPCAKCGDGEEGCLHLSVKECSKQGIASGMKCAAPKQHHKFIRREHP